jgi:small subunit ribosomal protein S7
MVQKNQKKHKFMKLSIPQYFSSQKSFSNNPKLVQKNTKSSKNEKNLKSKKVKNTKLYSSKKTSSSSLPQWTNPRVYQSKKALSLQNKALNLPPKIPRIYHSKKALSIESNSFRIYNLKKVSNFQIKKTSLIPVKKASILEMNKASVVQMNKTPVLEKKKKETKGIFSTLSLKKSLPCLFVNSLENKNEVLGTPLVLRLIRFLTKKGKKSKAYLLFAKVSKLLALFEAEKMDSKSLPKDKPSEVRKDLLKKTEKSLSIYETYKSQKLSQLNLKLESSIVKKNSEYKNEKSKFSSNILVEQAVSHVKPFVEVKKVRVAGTTYQVPAILEKDRQENFALKWILQSAFERNKKNPSQGLEYSLALEIYEASKKQGQARLKRNELHKLAESQRAFAHFRWW